MGNVARRYRSAFGLSGAHCRFTVSFGETQILVFGSHRPPFALTQRPRGEVGGSAHCASAGVASRSASDAKAPMRRTRMISLVLVHHRARELDDRRPFGQLGLEELHRLLRAAAEHRIDPGILQAL